MGGATVYAADTDSQAQVAVVEMQQCVQAGNVSATINDETARVHIYNANNYRVTVNYTVTALTEGTTRRIEVSAGTVTLDGGKDTGFNAAKGYKGYSIKITVYKCE